MKTKESINAILYMTTLITLITFLTLVNMPRQSDLNNDEYIETCQKGCEISFDHYAKGEQNILCFDNWCKHECYKICKEEIK